MYTLSSYFQVDYYEFKNLKRDHCYFAEDYIKELDKNQSEIEKNCEFSGQSLKLGQERFKCGELLFHPYIAGKPDSKGVDQIIVDSILKCDPQKRNLLYKNIIVCGATSSMKGFVERLEKEVRKVVPDDIAIKIVAPEERAYATWVGGSILGAVPKFTKCYKVLQSGVNISNFLFNTTLFFTN